MESARNRLYAAFEFFTKLGVSEMAAIEFEYSIVNCVYPPESPSHHVIMSSHHMCLLFFVLTGEILHLS